MDILVSSNLERLIFEITNRNSEETAKLMEKLNKNGAYKISELSKKLLNDFYGNYANTEEVYNAINKVYNEKKYLIDTHTAVGYVVLEKYRKETSDYTEALVVSTASPYKFPRSICRALELDIEGKNDFELLNLLEEYTKIKIPKNLKELDKKKVLHKDVYEKKEMKQALLKFLKVNYND